MKKGITRLTSLLLTVIFSLSFSVTAFAASIPRPSDEPDRDNIMKLLKEYIPEAYYIASETINDENNIMSFMNNNEPIWGSIDTAIHEGYHMYSNRRGIKTGTYGTYVYVNGHEYNLKYDTNKIFKTEKIASVIPDKLKTFRFNTYVVGNAYSNSYGIQGLMEEFTAYFYGLLTSSRMIDYLIEYDETGIGFQNFSADVSNNMTSYREFTFFIYQYLMYAKEKHPQTYELFMSSGNFTKAFVEVSQAYEDEIKVIIDRLPEINKYLLSHFNAKLVMDETSFSYYQDGQFKYGGPLKDYTTLSTELTKKKYVELEAEIKKAAGITTPVAVTNNNSSSCNSSNTSSATKASKLNLSLLRISEGALIEVNGQEGYDVIIIYKRDSKTASYKYLGILFPGCSYYLDKTAKGSVSYFVVGIKMSGNTILTTKTNIITMYN